jgi:hypothetical protein
MLRIRTSAIRGVRADSLSLRNKRRQSLVIAYCITRAAHPTFRRCDMLSRYQDIVGVMYNHAHR